MIRKTIIVLCLFMAGRALAAEPTIETIMATMSKLAPAQTCRVSLSAYLDNVTVAMGQQAPSDCQFRLDDIVVIQKIKDNQFLIMTDPNIGNSGQGSQAAILVTAEDYNPYVDLVGRQAFVVGKRSYTALNGFSNRVYVLVEAK